MHLKQTGQVLKRISSLVGIGLLAIFFVPCCRHGDGDNRAAAGKKWVLLLYDDADFFQAGDPYSTFSMQAWSGENLDVIVLRDTNYGPAKMYYIAAKSKAELIGEMGEVNMGDYRTFYDFLSFTKRRYPADRYFLCIYNHGGGWRGCCRDITSNDDQLSMDEMQRGLRDCGGVDILCFTAPCFMGALESVYELRKECKIYIGSEAGSGYIFWIDTIRTIRDMLEFDTDISNIDLAGNIVNEVVRNTSLAFPETMPQLTMGAVRTDKISAVAEAVNDLCRVLLADPLRSGSMTDPSYSSVQSFERDTSERFVDIFDFAEKYRSQEPNPENRGILQRLMEKLDDAIIAEYHGSSYPGAHGLSLYFPNPLLEPPYDPTYHQAVNGLDFTADTLWDEFLSGYIRSCKP